MTPSVETAPPLRGEVSKPRPVPAEGGPPRSVTGSGARVPSWSQGIRLSPSLSVPLSLPPSLSDFPESHIASNDSDSELEEVTDLLSPVGGAALHRLSLLEKQGSEASVDEGRDSCSGSEEQLGAEAGAAGDGDRFWEGLGEGLARRLSESNANQSSNNVAQAQPPALQLHGGQVLAGSGPGRQPELV